MEKKAQAIIKVYNDLSLSSMEWRIVGFHVYNQARQGVLDNLLTFHDGLVHYMNSEYYPVIPGQQEFDFGGIR